MERDYMLIKYTLLSILILLLLLGMGWCDGDSSGSDSG